MRIGILGAGQLGRMLAQAGIPLGHSFNFYDTQITTTVTGLGESLIGSFDDRSALKAFAARCDVVTYEFENVPCESARYIESLVPIFPSPRALEISQDRSTEKQFLQDLGIAVPRFRTLGSERELREACEILGLPCIAKTRRFGYDGKGQARIESDKDITAAWRILQGAPLIVEGFVPFSRELSVIATRDKGGEICVYPLSCNTHIDGILHRSELPAPDISSALKATAHKLIARVMTELDYIGTLAIELFEVRGEILANEMAPRVHNSGHATIDCITSSQFENHIRAITGTQLGCVEPQSRAVMFNVIGSVPSFGAVEALPNARIHMYGKEPRPGRKLGHITLLNPSKAEEDMVDALTRGR
jgi:5-(carboxyamino)imidazole ribonucleotide synthase